MYLQLVFLHQVFLIFFSRVCAEMVFRQYVPEIENFMRCPEPKYKDIESPLNNLKFRKLNATSKAVSLEFTLKRPLGSNIGTKATLEKWGNSGWVQIPFIPLMADACSVYLKYFGEVWMGFWRSAGAKNPEKCPIPPGDYKIKNFVFDISCIINTPHINGRFKVTALFIDMNTKETIMCIQTMINIKQEAVRQT